LKQARIKIRLNDINKLTECKKLGSGSYHQKTVNLLLSGKPYNAIKYLRLIIRLWPWIQQKGWKYCYECWSL